MFVLHNETSLITYFSLLPGTPEQGAIEGQWPSYPWKAGAEGANVPFNAVYLWLLFIITSIVSQRKKGQLYTHFYFQMSFFQNFLIFSYKHLTSFFSARDLLQDFAPFAKRCCGVPGYYNIVWRLQLGNTFL